MGSSDNQDVILNIVKELYSKSNIYEKLKHPTIDNLKSVIYLIMNKKIILKRFKNILIQLNTVISDDAQLEIQKKYLKSKLLYTTEFDNFEILHHKLDLLNTFIQNKHVKMFYSNLICKEVEFIFRNLINPLMNKHGFQNKFLNRLDLNDLKDFLGNRCNFDMFEALKSHCDAKDKEINTLKAQILKFQKQANRAIHQKNTLINKNKELTRKNQALISTLNNLCHTLKLPQDQNQ